MGSLHAFLTARLDDDTTAADREPDTIEAMRRIVADYLGLRQVASELSQAPGDDATEQTAVARNMYAGLLIALKHLATIYADHPDYRQEWKP